MRPPVLWSEEGWSGLARSGRLRGRTVCRAGRGSLSRTFKAARSGFGRAGAAGPGDSGPGLSDWRRRELQANGSGGILLDVDGDGKSAPRSAPAWPGRQEPRLRQARSWRDKRSGPGRAPSPWATASAWDGSRHLAPTAPARVARLKAWRPPIEISPVRSEAGQRARPARAANAGRGDRAQIRG